MSDSFQKQGRLRVLFGATELWLSNFGGIVRPPVVFDPFQPRNLSGSAINAVAIDYWTRFGVSAAFGFVIFAEDKLKVSVGCLFGAIDNTIQRDSVRINAVMPKGALE
jgi:hypothetical protein